MVPNARKAPTQPGLITRSAYSAEPSRRAAPERRTARQGRPSGRAPAPRSAHIAHAPPSAEPPGRERGPQGEPPLRASPGACGARGARGTRAHRKAPSASATPCPPAALRCSTLGEGGLNCRVRDGTGGAPPLWSRSRGALPRGSLVFEPARNPFRGDPGGRMAGTGEDGASRSVLHRGCEELGLLVPLG